MKKKYFIFILSIALIGMGIFNSGVMAKELPDSKASLVDRIAAKFNLNQTEVEEVFDEFYDERQADRETEIQIRLDQLVTNGKISPAQKDLIVAKRAELEATRQDHREEMVNMTSEERAELMKTHHDELETWANANQIDLSYLMMGGMRGQGNGVGMKMGRGEGRGNGMGRGMMSEVNEN